MRTIARHHRGGPAGPGGGRRRAFTLVEVLVIIMIIGLLMAILAPAVAVYRRRVMDRLASFTIRQLDAAVLMYALDFNDFPPSRDGTYKGPDGTHPGDPWRGSQLLCLLLTGYGPDPGTKGEPSGPLYADDGCEGYGFRLGKRGKVYGPYTDTDKATMRGKYHNPNGSDYYVPRFFVDVYDNPILYYKFDKDANTYHEHDGVDDHSNPSNADFPTPGPWNGKINEYAQNSGGRFFRTDFLLITQGGDKTWASTKNSNGDLTYDVAAGIVLTSDDLTNFFLGR